MIYAYVICINEYMSCHVCMRYIQLKLANVQSETLIIKDPKIFQTKFRSKLSIRVITCMVLDLCASATDT